MWERCLRIDATGDLGERSGRVVEEERTAVETRDGVQVFSKRGFGAIHQLSTRAPCLQ